MLWLGRSDIATAPWDTRRPERPSAIRVDRHRRGSGRSPCACQATDAMRPLFARGQAIVQSISRTIVKPAEPKAKKASARKADASD
jgi:hypothetical protein